MELSERKKKILRTVVEDYIETAEPVGSKAVAGEMDVSSATVRNEMAELESLGYLEQPHTSAGRVPSPQGYRLYVNELMERHRLSLAETEEINRSLKSRLNQLDKVLADAGQLASQLTDYPAYSMYAAADMTTIVRFDLIYVDANTFIIVVMLANNTVKNKLVRLPACVQQETLVKLATVFNASFTNITEEKITASLIASTERALGDTLGLVAVTAGFAIETLTDVKKSQAFVSGASHLLLHPEYRDVGKAQRLMNYLSDGRELLKLPVPETSDVKITIGPENLHEELHDSSVVVAKYDAGDNMQGLIGVVGPTRMDYSRVAAKLSYIAGGLSRLIAGGDVLPPQLSGAEQKDDKET
ncbi:MAG: heat-inducible transcription repressor HrcA [Oscillospiraceae bacterium]|nr:heat-inducible transcription repressor HrcA [Oscillospiraceae bacterium]